MKIKDAIVYAAQNRGPKREIITRFLEAHPDEVFRPAELIKACKLGSTSMAGFSSIMKPSLDSHRIARYRIPDSMISFYGVPSAIKKLERGLKKR